MAKYFCRNVVELPADYLALIEVPEDTTINAGEVYVVNSLVNENGNFQRYTPTTISNVSNQEIAIVLNGGFDTLSDGRRPIGNPNYGTYSFTGKEVVDTIRCNMPNIRFEISRDCITNGNSAIVGGYLIPVNGSNKLSYVAAGTQITARNYFKIEAVKDLRMGGLFGDQTAPTIIVRTVKTTSPALSGLNIGVETGLQEDNANVASGATIANMAPVGGTSPFVYTFQNNVTTGKDNGKFVIDGTDINVGADALTEGEYNINIKVTDAQNNSVINNAVVTVEASA